MCLRLLELAMLGGVQMHSPKRHNTKVWEGGGVICFIIRNCIEKKVTKSCLNLKSPSQSFWQLGSAPPSVPGF